MSFTLNSIITIGAYKFKGVHEVKISKSIYHMNETCLIKLPTTFRLRKYDKLSTVSVSTALQFTEGEKVEVKLGYNGNYKTEFEGFVRRLDFSTPCEIECEGYVYQLRKKKLTPKTFVGVDFKDIIRYIIEGTDIVLSASMKKESIKVEKFIIKTDTGAEVLQQLNKHLTGVLNITFHGKELYAGVTYLDATGTTNGQVLETVKYKMGWNVIKDNGLRLRIPPVDKVNIQITGVNTDGTKVRVKSDNTSENIKRIRTHSVTDQASLNYLAKLHQQKETYTGYEGKITGFGIPFCEHGWRVELTDPRYTERDGVYLADSVEVIFGLRGFRRIVGLGVKIN